MWLTCNYKQYICEFHVIVQSGMDESAIQRKIALAIVKIALGFALCNFPVAMHFSPNCIIVI